MLNPSRTVLISIGVLAFVGVFLGLTTDLGLFGWAAGALLAIYLAAVGIARLARRPA